MSSRTESTTGRHAGDAETTPPLESGDHLTRPEFERRFEAEPGVKEAELIEGVVYMPSPVRYRHHGRPHAHLITWLGVYESETPGVETADSSTARLDLDNEPQPDAILLIAPERGGQARISPEDFLEEAPELVAEVASSSVSLDLNAKMRVYRRNGVREYIVWRVIDCEFDWFILRDGEYQRIPQDTTGVIKSEIFPGLWLDTHALIASQLGPVLATLQLGIARPEHAAFVQQLSGGGIK